MKKYLSFFRVRFSMGIQYRAAAIAGVVTQFLWGGMELLAYWAFYQAQPEAFPMTYSATACYVWLNQALFALFTAWVMESEIFDSILNGNIAYELCRPIHIYDMWFARSAANRFAKATLRCFPILILAALLPKPYGLSAPASFGCFALFFITLTLGFFVTVAFTMLIYVATCYTISPLGLKVMISSTVELFAGSVIPLPFFPYKIQRILELLPFASMQNVPFRIYSGSMSSGEMIQAIILQVFWLVVLIVIGRSLSIHEETKVSVQGG